MYSVAMGQIRRSSQRISSCEIKLLLWDYFNKVVELVFVIGI